MRAIFLSLLLSSPVPARAQAEEAARQALADLLDRQEAAAWIDDRDLRAHASAVYSKAAQFGAAVEQARMSVARERVALTLAVLDELEAQGAACGADVRAFRGLIFMAFFFGENVPREMTRMARSLDRVRRELEARGVALRFEVDPSLPDCRLSPLALHFNPGSLGAVRTLDGLLRYQDDDHGGGPAVVDAVVVRLSGHFADPGAVHSSNGRTVEVRGGERTVVLRMAMDDLAQAAPLGPLRLSVFGRP